MTIQYPRTVCIATFLAAPPAGARYSMSPTAYPCWDGLRWLRVPSFEGACIGGDPLDCDKIPAVIFYQFNHIADLGHTGSIQQSNGLSLVTLRLVYLLSI